MGQKVPFNFGQKVVGEEFKLQVYKATKKLFSEELDAKLAGEIIVVPSSSKVPKINKVELFNRGAKDPNKASYNDTLVARAYCIAMFNQEVEFHLWEDDAPGGGHNATINKNNQFPQAFRAKVNEKGIAEVKISLLSNAAVLKAIANKYMMQGDKDEGADHEYYVTASYAGKIQKASQVNVDVANPNNKAKPKDDSAIFPGTSAQSGRSDKEAKITHAYFVNMKGQPVTKVQVGDTIKVRIRTANMLNEKIQFVVWEYDVLSNDKIYESQAIVIKGDLMDMPAITITPAVFNKGIDSKYINDPDQKLQQYFIEVIPLKLKVSSSKFGLADGAEKSLEVVRSAAKVENKKAETKNSSCICQEQYKELVWGAKVSCEFRKKVVQICADLWGESRKMEMANGLMAVINVETSGSFKAQQVEGWRSVKDPAEMTIKDFWKNKQRKSSSAVGLIQFTQEALQINMKEYVSNSKLTIEQRFDELNKLKLSYAQMGEIKQLDKVKKYFSNIGGIKTPEDIYLAVFAPRGVGKDKDYVLYRGGTEEYNANLSVDTKSRGPYSNDGNIQRSEILERFYDSVTKGESNKAEKYICQREREIAIGKVSSPGYYTYLDGSLKYIRGTKEINFYVETTSGSNSFKKVATLNENTFGMVNFPTAGKGFNRYGTEDKGGKSGKEDVGKGDRYLLPSTAAALFGVIQEISNKGWEIHFGDMSSENGSDPWESGSKHHAGHGHMGNRKGLDIDFRYLNKTGISFQGLNTSANFDNDKNEDVYKIGYKFGFGKNYASGLDGYKKYGVNPAVGGHYDHGHFGMSNLSLETVDSVDAKIAK